MSYNELPQVIMQFATYVGRTLNKSSNKKRTSTIFCNSVFSDGKLRGSSLTYLPVYVVLLSNSKRKH